MNRNQQWLAHIWEGLADLRWRTASDSTVLIETAGYFGGSGELGRLEAWAQDLEQRQAQSVPSEDGHGLELWNEILMLTGVVANTRRIW